jgi:class 3 adenylate cyclase/tetratricopeptide (TPR) repeat protein
VICPACGTENRAGRKFCVECGAALARTCPSCATPYEPGERFCGECGAALSAQPRDLPSPTPAPAAERRLVSVLFADLVGFTTLSESRDAEEVRELLSRYFESCKRLISLYGGTVEKFIGDEVMAVWGTPVAQEDDAERAVRTALDLVAAVSALGDEVGAPELRARAGVLTGEAAVTIGAEGEGMVAGDLVNTASRIQSAAEPGTVLVGESTKRASEAAIAYAEAGAHELKGKAEPVPLFRALRVTAGRAGALKGEGLEPPFVGRDRELRLVKELFHASAEEKKAHLVSVVGIAGIGKSRLAWEFFKYIDGLTDLIWWRRGRCLAYGEGVAYWALAEMVRMHADIVEGEEPATARSKLRTTVEELISDPGERDWIEPRLAHLLGLEERSAHERDDLFAAWRLFFERMADQGPAVLVFEDMQWADASLLEFIEYLLEWSRTHSLFVLTLSRPELAERHPGFGASGRNVTTLSLEPLSEMAMEALLSGLVPGLPEELQGQILGRAEGVPLYAVETVRMLLDRGLLVREGEEYHPTDDIAMLAVPETLHALIAARLDGLSAEERRLIQDASVLGKIFTKQALSSLSGVPESELEPLLQRLVRKEVLFVQADPRSPDRGQYGFLQDLLKRVAYETLAKGERKSRHLDAARALAESFGPTDPEIVEVLAAHYLAAYEVSPEAADAREIKANAREMLARAGERAASLAAGDEAARYFAQAAELSDEPLVQAEMYERAGEIAWASVRGDLGRGYLERAMSLLETESQTHAAARVSARLGEITWGEGHIDHAVEQMEKSFEILSGDEPDEDLAALAAQLGRFLFFMGQPEQAARRIEQALRMAESLFLPGVLSQALNTKGLILLTGGRPEEGLALIKHALRVGLDNDAPTAALRAYNNVADVLYAHDQNEASLEYARDGLAFARRMGDRNWESSLLAVLVSVSSATGGWEDALAHVAELSNLADAAATRFAAGTLPGPIVLIHTARGPVEEARRALQQFESFRDSPDVQERSGYDAARAAVLRAENQFAEALQAASQAIESGLGPSHQNVKMGLVEALEASFALGDLERVTELLALVESYGAGELTPYVRAQASRFRARLAAEQGQPEQVEAGFEAAAELFREIGTPYPLAVTLLEHGEWLGAQGRADQADPLLNEARELFERLQAKPWLERADQARRVQVEAGASA